MFCNVQPGTDSVSAAHHRILPDIIAEFGIGRLPCKHIPPASYNQVHLGTNVLGVMLTVSQMLLEIHAQFTAHSYSTSDFNGWWESLEEAGLRAFTSELNYPAIHCRFLLSPRMTVKMNGIR
jgi:hypothetical protein